MVRKIISVILVFSMVLIISGCSILKDNPDLSNNKPADLSDEMLVGACLENMGSFRLYENFQKYCDEFVRRDGEKMYQAFSTYVKQNKLARTDEEKLILYDSMLWQYFSSYFYDWETKEIAVNHSLLSAVFESCDKLFKTQKDTYIYCTTYTYFFDDSETLNKEIINFLFYYTIRCDSEKRFRILNDLIYVCWELNMSNEKDVCEAICFTKVLNTEIIKQESGNGKIDVNDLYELTALAKKVWADEKPSYDTLIDIYGTEPEIVYHEDNVTYLYTSDNYTSVCYGEPIYATVIFDHSNNELVYYKSKTIRGVIVDSENPESQSADFTIDSD